MYVRKYLQGKAHITPVLDCKYLVMDNYAALIFYYEMLRIYIK